DLPHDIVMAAESLGILTRQHFDLPPAQRAGAWYECRRPRKPAILDGARRKFHWTDDARIDDHPPFGEAGVLEPDVGMSSYEAVGAIAAKQNTRTQSALCALHQVAHAECHTFFILRESDGALPQEHIGAVRNGAVPEHPLQLRLNKRDSGRPGKRIRRG